MSPVADPVRFSVRPVFSFPASDIQQLELDGNSRPPRMSVNFMGLIGPKGVLPDWYNTHAQNLNYRNHYGFTDFLDPFHHRLISLFSARSLSLTPKTWWKPSLPAVPRWTRARAMWITS